MPTFPPGASAVVIDSTGKFSFAIDSLPVSKTYDGSGNVLTATYGPDANGKFVRRTSVWAGTQQTSQSAYLMVANELTLSAAAAGGQPSVASAPFTVNVGPLGSIVDGPITVTPSDNGAGGTFSPVTLSLAAASPAGTFTYTPAAAGAITISITNGGILSNPVALTYLSAGAYPGAPTIGALTPAAGAISVAFSAPSNNGGSPIDLFEIRLSTGEFAIGYTSPIVVSTTASHPVRAIGRAHNSLGWGAPSMLSAYVIPLAAATSGGNFTTQRASNGNAIFA